MTEIQKELEKTFYPLLMKIQDLQQKIVEMEDEIYYLANILKAQLCGDEAEEWELI